jgi:hypothetical protein
VAKEWQLAWHAVKAFGAAVHAQATAPRWNPRAPVIGIDKVSIRSSGPTHDEAPREAAHLARGEEEGDVMGSGADEDRDGATSGEGVQPRAHRHTRRKGW